MTPSCARSFQYAFQGLRRLYGERNARSHAAVTALVIGLGWALGLPPLEWILLAPAATLVWVAEAMNTTRRSRCCQTQ